MTAGVNLVHVPFRGNGPALTAMLGGQVEVGADPQLLTQLKHWLCTAAMVLVPV